MKAINVVEGSLVWDEAVTPDIGPGLIRISNRATAIKRADLAQRAGAYPPPPGASPILGLECAGTVEEGGDGVTRVSPGDSVCALLSGGGYAEQVVVPAGQVLPIPRGLSFVEAASLPEVYATAFLNLYIEAQAKRNEIVLVHAGASGVGTASIQMCRSFGNPCFITAGSEEKIERCIKLGAENGANRKAKHFFEILRDWSSGRGIDVILDPVGAEYLESNLSLLALEGRLVLIGLRGGASAELTLGRMMQRRLRIIGSTLRARSVAAKSSVIDALESQVWPLIESGDIQPVVETVLPIQQANLAHELLATNDTFGKVVLSID